MAKELQSQQQQKQAPCLADQPQHPPEAQAAPSTAHCWAQHASTIGPDNTSPPPCNTAGSLNCSGSLSAVQQQLQHADTGRGFVNSKPSSPADTPVGGHCKGACPSDSLLPLHLAGGGSAGNSHTSSRHGQQLLLDCPALPHARGEPSGLEAKATSSSNSGSDSSSGRDADTDHSSQQCMNCGGECSQPLDTPDHKQQHTSLTSCWDRKRRGYAVNAEAEGHGSCCDLHHHAALRAL